MAKVRMAFAFFCDIIKVQKYNRRIVTVHTVTENGNL